VARGPKIGTRGAPRLKHPPLPPLRALVERLDQAGIRCALGGSGLLAALGLARTARDWDLTTDEDPRRVRSALAGLAFGWKGSDALHADQKFELEDGEIELIVGFAFHTPKGVVRVPTVISGRWQGVPTGSPECWLVAYRLMRRGAKARALLAHLRRRGADRDVCSRLATEPLPARVGAELASLPIRSQPPAPGAEARAPLAPPARRSKASSARR
jgi:hypothetical protein